MATDNEWFVSQLNHELRLLENRLDFKLDYTIVYNHYGSEVYLSVKNLYNLSGHESSIYLECREGLIELSAVFVVADITEHLLGKVKHVAKSYDVSYEDPMLLLSHKIVKGMYWGKDVYKFMGVSNLISKVIAHYRVD